MGSADPIARTVLAATTLTALLSAATAAQEADRVRAFVANAFHITSAELAKVGRGEVVARTIDAKDDREVATLGVARMRTTPEFYVERLHDIAGFKQADAVLQIGAFSTPPRIEDVAGLTLEEADIKSLRSCRVGRCGLQLTADAIRRFNALPWRDRNPAPQANALMRKILVEAATEYRHSGTAAMHYADQEAPSSLHEEFASLVSTGTGGWHLFPELTQHLVTFPPAARSATEDLLYWSKEQVGRKTVVSVTHLAIHRLGPDSPAAYAVASRQIYGSHYYDSSLGLTVLLRDPSEPSPSTFIVYVNRSRIDMFGGLFGGMVKSVVSSRARSTVGSQLERMRHTLERDFRQSTQTAR